ncbi:uncharacterized protein [Diabrotica undecimpunctata]|uniref:uncharacterized protein isoform X3 n=1 Tax=Diabrotica undecimpunctata TaxID=50387 RepID=UPI003B6375AB
MIVPDRPVPYCGTRNPHTILPDITNPRYTLSSEEKHKICKAWKQTADNFSPDTDSSNDEGNYIYYYTIKDSLDCPITTTKEYL